MQTSQQSQQLSDQGMISTIEEIKVELGEVYRAAARLNGMAEDLPNPSADKQVHALKEAIQEAFQNLDQAFDALSKIK